MVDRSTSPSLPGAPANLPGPAFSKEEPTVRYGSSRGNSQEQIAETGLSATEMIEMTQVHHRGVNLTRCLLLQNALLSVGVRQ